MKTRIILVAVLLIVAAGIAAPYLNADRFASPIRAELERSLRRKVDIRGPVRFNLFTGPGFSLEDVEIQEDPSVGIEPFAYVSSLEARVAFSTLWHGRLEFSTLRLVEPTVNLVRSEGKSWNVQPLVTGSGAPAARARHSVPEIQVREGRVNFKFGDTKSVFYLKDADVDISPNGGQSVSVRFSGEPARTDRAAQGFGKLAGRGRLYWFSDKPAKADFDVDLERSAIAELVTLLEGHDVWLHGLVAARAHVSGPLADLQITGDLRVEDIHRWDLMPAKGGGWPIRYRGRWNFPAGEIALDALPADNPNQPLAIRVRAHDILSRPRWAAVATISRLRAATMLEVLRHIGIALPDSLAVDGELVGVLGYVPRQGWQGQVMLLDGVVHPPDGAAPTHVRNAQIVIAGDLALLAPADIEVESGGSAQVQAQFDAASQSLAVRVSSQALNVGLVQAGSGLLLGAVPVPVLEHCRRGTWKGWLQYARQKSDPGSWSGDLRLLDAAVSIPGLAEPLRIESADIALLSDRARLQRIRGKAGEIEFEADYRYEPAEPRPHRLRLRLADLDVAELERLMLPTLRRSQSFLARTLHRAAVPEWLRDRHAEAQLHVDSLWAGEALVGALEGRLIWDGAQVDLTGASLRLEEGVAKGRLSVRLQNSEPEYRAQGRVEGLPWKGGRVDADVRRAEATGVGLTLLRSAKVNGAFAGRGLSFGPDAEFRSATGDFEISLARGIPRLSFTSLEVLSSSETWNGQGASDGDGKLQFELTAGRKQMRLAGGVWPLQLEMVR